MKFKFLVEYDTDEGFYRVTHHDPNTWLSHSGSSYYRIKRRGEQYQYGTIGFHPPYPDTSFTETHNWLQIAISKQLPEQIPEQPHYNVLESTLIPPFVDPQEKIQELEGRIENAGQAMSETHSSWKSRCFAITAALDMDYGNPDDEMPDANNKKVDSIKELKFWLEGALQCKEWNWSPDQAGMAQEAIDRATEIIKEYEDDNR